MNRETETAGTIAVAIAITMLIGVSIVFAVGWAISTFWNFFAPLFDAPEASWLNGIGFVGVLMCVRAVVGTSITAGR